MGSKMSKSIRKPVARKSKAAPKRAKPVAKPTSFVLRCCDANLRSHGGFQWPSQVGAEVSAPDWNDEAECGNGLHGWLYGQGDHGCVTYHQHADAKWLVLEVESAFIVMLGGKCKFPHCVVRYIGDMAGAAAFILANEPRSATVAVIGASLQVGENSAVTVGAFGTATAGYRGTATAGYSGSATAGGSGSATAGDSGTATAGYSGSATAGGSGSATAGDSGTATAGDSGTATAGYRGTATAGYSGTATAGDSGTATAGDSGTATAGYRGELRIRFFDAKNERYRTAIAYVGENGIKANTKYRLDENNAFVEVTP
jgi:hypothetical protein